MTATTSRTRIPTPRQPAPPATRRPRRRSIPRRARALLRRIPRPHTRDGWTDLALVAAMGAVGAWLALLLLWWAAQPAPGDVIVGRVVTWHGIAVAETTASRCPISGTYTCRHYYSACEIVARTRDGSHARLAATPAQCRQCHTGDKVTISGQCT